MEGTPLTSPFSNTRTHNGTTTYIARKEILLGIAEKTEFDPIDISELLTFLIIHWLTPEKKDSFRYKTNKNKKHLTQT